MAPIKIGFMGLSSTQSWAVWAHLPYLKSTSKYEVVALCNSSVESAQAAIKAHGLAPTTKAYGSPEDLAADPDVELVVCSIRVDKHYEALLPVLNAGKDVYSEWPLAKDAAEAESLLALAQEKGVKTIVGLQAHQSPSNKKIKEIIQSGKIGKVLSSTFHGTPKFFGATEVEALGWSHDRSFGATMLSIYSQHALESIQFVLGPIASFTPVLAISYPESQLTDFSGKPTIRVPRTTHDQILLQGTLSSGTVLSYHLRGGPAFKKTDGHIWRIYGTNGEIQITGPDSWLHIADDNYQIEVFEHASGNTEIVTVEKDAFSEYTLFSRNIGRLYEAIADGKGEDGGVLGWDTAVKRHRFIAEVYEKAGVH